MSVLYEELRKLTFIVNEGRDKRVTFYIFNIIYNKFILIGISIFYIIYFSTDINIYISK